ncbi:allophanate hydrolase [Candidatus Pelagibacter sp.]|nr:allophanate hydrolase [Candidatus Pelagibacter sp.]
MYFEVLRAGINTTIQDDGRKNLYHIGVTSSGAIDKKNYKLSNIILKNEINNPAIEFAFQGPHLKMKNGRCFICITGSVDFQLIRNNGLVEKGYGYKIYNLEEEDEIDILSTKSSVYGYLNVKNGFNFEKVWGSYSINTKANIGPNEGKKFSTNQKIYLNRTLDKDPKIIQLRYLNYKINKVRIIKGTNFDYFSDKAKKIFFSNPFIISNEIDRMGIRLTGLNLENVVSSNIKSEGLVKGTIQVTSDGNPIIMLADHGSIGGYPKIGTVISADLDGLAQLTPKSEVYFEEVSLEEAEELYKKQIKELNKYIYTINEFN